VIVMLMAAGGGVVIVCVLGWGLVAAGLRAGDHPGDAAVGAVLGPGPRPVIIAIVRNPADVPLVAGLTVRRQLLSGLLDPGLTVRVPRRTARRKFLAGEQDTVGVVPAGGQAEFRMTAPALLIRSGLIRSGLIRSGLTRSGLTRSGLAGTGRRYRLTAVVGQAGGRLRVIGVPVVSGGPAGAGRPAPAARAGDRD